MKKLLVRRHGVVGWPVKTVVLVMTWSLLATLAATAASSSRRKTTRTQQQQYPQQSHEEQSSLFIDDVPPRHRQRLRSLSRPGMTENKSLKRKEENSLGQPEQQQSQWERPTEPPPQLQRRRRQQSNSTTSSSCQLDDSGNYGVLLSPKSVDYFYQITVPNGTSQNDVVTTILPELRLAIINGILPDLFVCPTIQNKTEILGISSYVEDIVSPHECLLEGVGDDEVCFTLKGRPLLWSRPTVNTISAQFTLRSVIHSYIYRNANDLITTTLVDNNQIRQLEYFEELNNDLFRLPPPITIAPTPAPISPPPPTPAPIALTPPPTPAPITVQPTVALNPPTTIPTKPPSNPITTNAPSLRAVPTTAAPQSPTTTTTIPTTPPAVATLPTEQPVANNLQRDNDGNDDDDDESFLTWWLWVVIGIGGLVIAAVVLVVCCYCVSGGAGAGRSQDMAGGAAPMDENDVSMEPMEKAVPTPRMSRRGSLPFVGAIKKNSKTKLTDNRDGDLQSDAEYLPPGEEYPEAAPMKFSVDDSELSPSSRQNQFGMVHSVFNQSQDEEDEEGEEEVTEEGEEMETVEEGDEEEGEYMDGEYEEEGEYMDGEYEEGEYDDGEYDDGEVEYDEEGNELYYEGEEEEDEEEEGNPPDDDEYTEYMEHNVLNDIHGYMQDSRVDAALMAGADDDYLREEGDADYHDDEEDDDDEEDEGEEYIPGVEYEDDGVDYEYGDEVGYEEDGAAAADTAYLDDSGYNGGDYIDGGYGGVDPSDEEDSEGEEDDDEEEEFTEEEYIDETIHEETTIEEEVTDSSGGGGGQNWASRSVS